MGAMGTDGLPLSGAGDVKRKHAVIRFERDVQFPRFSMSKGERWGFVVYGKTEAMLEAIRAGRRFDFAGGQGVPGDAVIVYEGDSDREFAKAAGYIRDGAGG